MNRLPTVGLASMILIAGILATGELWHVARFGHFVGPALHADFTMSHSDTGIPGITRVYDATLTNFSSIPKSVSACEFITDAMAPGTQIAYAIQKWDATTQAWKMVLQPSAAAFCKPYPLGIIQGRVVVTKRLWLGQNVSIGGEATGARFHKGDTVRFLLFAHELWTSSSGYATSAFKIDEEVNTVKR